MSSRDYLFYPRVCVCVCVCVLNYSHHVCAYGDVCRGIDYRQLYMQIELWKRQLMKKKSFFHNTNCNQHFRYAYIPSDPFMTILNTSVFTQFCRSMKINIFLKKNFSSSAIFFLKRLFDE